LNKKVNQSLTPLSAAPLVLRLDFFFNLFAKVPIKTVSLQTDNSTINYVQFSKRNRHIVRDL